MINDEIYLQVLIKGIKTAAAYIYEDDIISYSFQMKEIKRFAKLYDLDIRNWYYDNNPKRVNCYTMAHNSPSEDCGCIIAYRPDRMFDRVDDYDRFMEILQNNAVLFFCLDFFDETKISRDLIFRRFHLS